MKNKDLSLDERVTALEFLLDALVWGPHLNDKSYRTKVAEHLYMCVEASERHNAHPLEVQSRLLAIADVLAEIDQTPDYLKPTIRPFVGNNEN